MNRDLDIKSFEKQFIKLICNRLGIVIHSHQTNELLKTIHNGCQTFNCQPEAYLHRLATDPDNSPLLEHLIAGITVNETYFFRDTHQMQLLRETLLPQIIKSKRMQHNLSLRIWSAGCATGEEIYTIGMILKELLPDFAAWSLQLLGTDLNTRSLQKAMKGHYTEWSMRSISTYFKQHYFTHENNTYVLNQSIRDLVHYDYLNLNDDTYPGLFNGTNAQDLILCRNVLIYFDQDSISRLMKKMCHSLIPGGYLILGASDPIVTTGTDLKCHHQWGNMFSRSTGMESIPLPKKSEYSPRPFRSTIPRSLPIEKVSAPVDKPKIVAKVANLDPIRQLISDGRWQEALITIEQYEISGKKDSSLLNLKAMVFANLGQLDHSLQSCLESLHLDKTNKFAYFTFALTLMELNRLEEAESAFRKTLFLDRYFVIGHFQLGLLLLRKKQYDFGMKSLTNAWTLAKAKNPTELVPGYPELNYGKLSEIFKHEIDMYASQGVKNAS